MKFKFYSGLMCLRTAKPLEAWGKKCLVGRKGKLKQVCIYIYMYIYTHIYIHTYTYIYIYI